MRLTAAPGRGGRQAASVDGGSSLFYELTVLTATEDMLIMKEDVRAGRADQFQQRGRSDPHRQ